MKHVFSLSQIYTLGFLFLLLHVARSLYSLRTDVTFSAAGDSQRQKLVGGKGHLDQNVKQIGPNKVKWVLKFGSGWVFNHLLLTSLTFNKAHESSFLGKFAFARSPKIGIPRFSKIFFSSEFLRTNFE